MNVTRRDDAVPYLPPGHADVDARRLQGLEAGGPTDFWVARSTLDPGAVVATGPVGGDTVYVVLEGTLEVVLDDDPATSVALLPGDSAFLARGQHRSLRATGDAPTVAHVIVTS